MMQPLHIFAGLLLPVAAMGFHVPHARHHHPAYIRYFKEKIEKESQQQRIPPPSSDCMEARGTATALVEKEYFPIGDLSRKLGFSENQDIAKEYQKELQRTLQSSHRSNRNNNFVPLDATVSTPISYDEETTMVQTDSKDISKEYQKRLQFEQNAFVPLDASVSTPISYDEETGMVHTAVRAIVKHPIASFVDHQVVALSSTLVISLGAVHELVDCIELEWAHHATSSTEGLAILSLGHALHYGRETIRQLMEMDGKTEDEGGHKEP